LEDLGIYGKIVLVWILEKRGGWVSMDWILLAGDGDHWWVLVKMVINLWVP
jgi:hypothetical protein